MGENVNPALHARVVIERVVVKVAQFWRVPLQGGASQGRGDVGLDEGSSSESHQALKVLHKKHDIPVVYILPYWDYLTFSIRPIEVKVDVAQVGLVLPLCRSFR